VVIEVPARQKPRKAPRIVAVKQAETIRRARLVRTVGAVPVVVIEARYRNRPRSVNAGERASRRVDGSVIVQVQIGMNAREVASLGEEAEETEHFWPAK
jgi:hypothetical protein